MTTRVSIKLLMGLIVALPLTAAKAQNIVTNGSFEAPVTAGVKNYCTAAATAARPDICTNGSTFGGWTVSVGSVEHIPSSAWLAADGSQSVDVNGIFQGGLYQDLATTAGSSYSLRFAMSGNFFNQGYGDTRTLNVFWGGADLGAYVFNRPENWSAQTMGWTYFTASNLTASESTTRLEFRSANGGDNCCDGAALDDVSVLEETTTPEPESLALVATGLIGLMGIALRRRSRENSVPSNRMT